MRDIDQVGLQAERDLFERLERVGIAPRYPVFWEYVSVDMDNELQLRIGVRLDEPLDAVPGLEVGVHPAGSYLTFIHEGDPNELYSVTAWFLGWAQEHQIDWDRSATDPNGWTCRLEEYFTDPAAEPDRAAWRTKLAFKIMDTGADAAP